jgi:class 3 adenylate cyclase/tetratricopeptide (TPR) repeat protein
MQDDDSHSLRAAIAALEAQRATLGDAVVELATAPLRARLASLQRPAGLRHRQVTVLFADVVGSTAMAQGLDAEDTLAILSGALRRMADIVEAHHGRVLRFTGDGVKAAFGMDLAREDDAERAVRAGLAIRQAGREQADAALRLHGVADFAVRVGVHTGDVALGAGIDADSTAIGVAVNVAARMEQSAPPGALRISHDTWSQVRGLFDMQAQPALLVKGIEAPMLTYLVHAALERSVASVERGLQGLRTPMVGRQAELQRLLDAVTRARETRQLQALTLVGDAGLGKSRLLRELTAGLAAAPHACRVLAVRAQPDGMLRPWGLLRGLLATQFGVADTDSALVAQRKVVQGLSPWFDERGERQAQLIGQLSGLDFGSSPHVRGLDPRSLRDQALAALRAYLQALAARTGTLPVLIVEDLHWADDSSLDLLQHLLAHAAELPLVLTMTARPALLTRRPDWATPDRLIPLAPLAASQSDALVQALLQRIGSVPPKLVERIAGQAEGNPYYMEELVRRLIDDGVIAADAPQWTLHAERLDELRLPGTLVGLLQARLDALPAAERQAARQASVIGHVFWGDALQAVDGQAPQSLPALQRVAVVRARNTSDFEGTTEHQFDHHLLHQVTYDTLLKAERRLGHGAVAHWLSVRTQGRGAEFLAMTGEHAERAGEVALAIDCFDQAAKEAQKRFANTAAAAWLRRALALLGESSPARRFELWSRLERIADIMGNRAGQDEAHAAMAAVLERHPDDALQARLWFALALLSERRSDSAASERHARQAFELAERCGAAMTAAKALGLLAYRLNVQQDFVGAGRQVEAGLAWAAKVEPENDRADTEAQLLNLSGMVAFQLCRFDEARTTLQAVLLRGQALGSPTLQLAALDNLAVAADCLGHWDEMADWASRMGALAQPIGALSHLGRARHLAAVAAEGQGDFAAAMAGHEQALAIFRTVGYRRMEALTLQRLGVSHLALGDAAAALQWHAQGQAVYQTLDLAVETCETLAFAALCQSRLGRVDEALAAVSQVLAEIGGQGGESGEGGEVGKLADAAADETILLRWTCQQVLQAAGDARAAPLLERLFADVQTRASALTSPADRSRLIQAIATFNDIVAAHTRALPTTP